MAIGVMNGVVLCALIMGVCYVCVKIIESYDNN